MNDPRKKRAISGAEAIQRKFLERVREEIAYHPKFSKLNKLNDDELLKFVGKMMKGEPGFSVLPFNAPMLFN